jgi:hypothetical protein
MLLGKIDHILLGEEATELVMVDILHFNIPATPWNTLGTPP